MFGIVGKSYIDRHLQLHLARVSLRRDGLVILVEACYLACQLQVAVLPHLLQLRLGGVKVCQLVLEYALHRRPHIGRTNGEIVDLYRLRLSVVDAGTIELITDGACRQGKE